jgi:hypothetical protein
MGRGPVNMARPPREEGVPGRDANQGDGRGGGTDGIRWIAEGKDYPRLWWELGDEDTAE